MKVEETQGGGAADGARRSTLILLRLGAELTIKSRRTRSHFQQRLLRNVRDALATTREPYRIQGGWGRVFLEASSPQAPALLARVFGISSLSPVEAVVPAEQDAIVAEGEVRFRERVRGRSFAVRARRAGRHSFSSQDIQVQLGAALLPHAARVDLDQPEVTVYVEVRDDKAYLFGERIAGAGGLPLGVEGNAVALLSGGYDSAVAAWLMLKRGIALDYVFCNLGGDAYERAVVQVAKVLADEWSYGSRPRLHVVDFGEVLQELRARVKPSYWQVVLKRLMYRAASRIGEERGAGAIVTGEAVGQVSSQTLTNLGAIEPAATLPLFRPLLGFDKEEIIARARQVGTAALSEQVKEYCAIAPGKPVTAASAEAVGREEAKMDAAVLDAALASRKVLDLRALTPTDLVAPYLFATEIPRGAVVLDCRPEPQYRAWHLPGAIRQEEWELLKGFRKLDKGRTYILYCAHGIQTAYLAERMQRAGYEAYSFKGGVRGVMRYSQGARALHGEGQGP
ncbi:MAG: tRNA 4-thiouridine(8) synthase ThiI [Gemmatimonadetes bacterium]|nr:tRNA 4-thiouridine(8) synthase ThiI [Gemmatimonadota bacterium]